VPSLFRLTSCTPTKSNLYLANFLAAAVSEPALYRLLTFHVPNLMSLFHSVIRTKVSDQVRGTCSLTKPVFTVRICQHLAQPPSWMTTPFRLSATAFLIYSQLPFLSEAVSSIRNLRTRHAVVTGTNLSRTEDYVCELQRTV